MISSEIRNFFGQLNFQLMTTNVPGVTIMRNESNGEQLYVALFDNDNRQIWNAGMIGSITSQLSSKHMYPDPAPYILVLVITDDPARDRYLPSAGSAKVWLVDTASRRLILQDEADDFFGLRYGLEQTIGASRSGNPWNLREAIKDKANFPFVTIVLIAVNVIWFIVLSFMGDTTDPQFMWSMGADFGYSVFLDHEFYRLVLSMFMHFGFLHLAGNMVYLAIAGTQAERAIGHLRFFLIYMLSGLAASIISTAYYFLTDYNTVSAGASGAIYGVIGIILYLMGRIRGKVGTAQLTSRIIVIVIFLIYSNFITPDVDVVAHLAGLVAGLLLSFAFLHTPKQQKTGEKSSRK